MNQKKAKLLRRLAKNIMNRTQDENSGHTAETQYVENEKNRKILDQFKTNKSTGEYVLDDHGVPIIEKRYLLAEGTKSLSPRCLKGIYNTLKKGA
jgi:hypothetical protein